MSVARKSLQDGETGSGEEIDRAQSVFDEVATMKRRSRSASLRWTLFLSYSRASELPVMCDDLRELITDINSKDGPTISSEY